MTALVEIRVELPAYSHTITISVPEESTVLDVKEEIFRACAGGPRVQGQRIIWRGRSLLDTEKVQELWQSPNDPRIVHLAVHPSAWTTSPPDISRPSLPETSSPAPATPSAAPLPTSFPAVLSSRLQSVYAQPGISAPGPLTYVVARHQQALNAMENIKVSPLDASTLAFKILAVQIVERHGWSWPPVLDEEFPLVEDGVGVKYERAIVDGQSYLRLVNPDSQPTAVQMHALNVLSHTFPILALPPIISQSRVIPSQTPAPNVQALLQQLGLPAVRHGGNGNLAPNAAPQMQAIDIPLRPLLIPLFFMTLRVAILLYFFAPARKPLFGAIIVMWMLYEVIRGGLIRGLNRAPEADQRAAAAGGGRPAQPHAAGNVGGGGGGAAAHPNAAANAAPAPAVPGAAPVGPRAAGANDFDSHIAAVFDVLGSYNLDNEQEILRVNAAEPTFTSRAMAFVTLFVATMHPAVWNRRRNLLRRRETQIRIDASARAADLDRENQEPEQQERIRRQERLVAEHQQRPRWIREYTERVVHETWVDEAD